MFSFSLAHLSASAMSGLVCLAAVVILPACQDSDELTPELVLGRRSGEVAVDAAAETDAEYADSGAPSSCTSSGCACTAGSAPRSCLPAPIYTTSGVKACTSGAMYCRDGAWTTCEALSTYSLEVAPLAEPDAAVEAGE